MSIDCEERDSCPLVHLSCSPRPCQVIQASGAAEFPVSSSSSMRRGDHLQLQSLGDKVIQVFQEFINTFLRPHPFCHMTETWMGKDDDEGS